jgi:hypothetical protein
MIKFGVARRSAGFDHLPLAKRGTPAVDTGYRRRRDSVVLRKTFHRA